MNNLGILLAILFVASAQTESNPTIVNGKIFLFHRFEKFTNSLKFSLQK